MLTEQIITAAYTGTDCASVTKKKQKKKKKH